MRPEELDFLYRLEETFWWFAGMRRITDAVVGRNLPSHPAAVVLDAGCGTGFNLSHLSGRGFTTFGIDISGAALSWVRKRGIETVCQASVTEMPFAESTFDMVFSFDVICQGAMPSVADALLEMRRVLRPGGCIFIRVPAFKWMRSSHDVAVDTTRRFTRDGLTRDLEEAGFQVDFISYANCFLFPVVLVRRLLLKSVGIGEGSDVREFPPGLKWIDSLFRRLLNGEAQILGAHKQLPFGLSLVCLARKP